MSKNTKQRGGTYKPAEYHGSNSGRYSATPSGLATGAYDMQIARSQGVIHGDTAGPNLAYSGGNMMTGGTYLPAEYHGSNSGRYSATPSGLATGAYGTQIARSQGVIQGDTAGPNLAYSGGNMMTGGKRTRRSTKKTPRRKHTKTGKTKKQKAGCGCARPGW